MVSALPAPFEQLLILNVSALSGKSCCFVLDPGVHRPKELILERFATLLDLPLRKVKEQGALLHDDSPTLLTTPAIRLLPCGQIHELQFLMRSSVALD
mmetsp:Transcript_54748/g.130588  ORF Transcript_54748/g.130588 Transcript_54748/m.130588 type:complete len:98 (+) Transcript_54748:2-295(+)